MAYTIVKSDGTILTTIPDGTINTDSTSVGLPGRYFAGYGQTVDTSFVHIIENFANTSPPANPLKGQIWFNTTDNFLYVCPEDGETNQNAWIKLAVTETNATSTFGGVIVTGNLQANNILANNSITGNSITVNYANVNTLATMSSANIYGAASIGSLTTRVITTGAATTTGTMTGTWTMTGGAVGNTLIVDGGNLYVSSGIIASSFTFPNGTPISPTGGYTNQNVNEYLQGTGNISIANRFSGNIYPSTVYAGNGTASAPSFTANSDTNTGIYFPATNTLGFTLAGNEKARFDGTVGSRLLMTASANNGNSSIQLQGETNSNVLGIFRSYGSNSTGTTFGIATANTVVIGGFGANIENFLIGTNENAPVIFAASAGEAMRITTARNVGIGTTSPTHKLQVNGNISATGNIFVGANLSVTGNANLTTNINLTGNLLFTANTRRIFGDFSTGNATGGNLEKRILFQTTTANSGTSVGAIPTSGTANIQTNFAVYNQPDPGNSQYCVMGINQTEMTIGGVYTGNVGSSLPLVFWSNAPWARITPTGNFLINKGTSDDTTETGFLFLPTGRASATTNDGAAAVNTWHLYNQNATNNGYRFYVNTNGGIYNYQANDVNLVSDERRKTDIKLAGSYLSKICQIPVKTFLYKDQEDEVPNLGVIAQDVEKVAPELVTINNLDPIPEDGIPYKGIYETDLKYALMKCIQEQQEIINDLKARIEKLENSV